MLMRVTVDTGLTATGKRLISYVCPECGEPVMQPYQISTDAKYEWGHLTHKKMIEGTKLNAALKLKQKDDTIAWAVNEKHKYRYFPSRIVCPKCNTVQPWSDRWRTSPQFNTWAMIMFCISCFAIPCMLLMWKDVDTFTDILIGKVLPLAVYMLASIPAIVYNAKAKKRLKQFEVKNIPYPIYYNQEMMMQMLRQQEMNRQIGVRPCCACGYSFAGNIEACPMCGTINRCMW